MDQRPFYLNPKIKKANLPEEYSDQDLNEYIKCSQNPIYFIENYVKINTVDKGLEPFILRGYQKKLIETFYQNSRVILLSARQSGKTITTAAFILWFVCFTPDKTAAILANKARTSREILSRIVLMLENLPFFLQPGVRVLNKGSIEFGNNSRIIAEATSADTIRGFTINFLYLDEFAFVPNAYEFFSSSYPTITSGNTSKIIISSTPNNLNLFYHLWMEAQKNKNGFTPFEIDWWEVPGRDENWKKEQISILGEEGFAREYGNEFLGSSNTLIRADKLKSLVPVETRRIGHYIQVVEEPKDNHIYVAAIDTSRGVGKDYSVIVILDVTQFPIKIVATYRNNTITPLRFPDDIMLLVKKYNNAFILIERNSNGLEVANILYNEFEYENIFSSKIAGRLGQTLTMGSSKQNILGVEMTKNVKRIGCSNLKVMIEEQKLINLTEEILLELYNFVRQGDTYAGENGEHDDMVMCLIMFSWALNQEYFKELLNTDLRRELQKDDDAVKFIPFFTNINTDVINKNPNEEILKIYSKDFRF